MFHPYLFFFLDCLYPTLPIGVKTSSSQLGPDEGGKCESVGQSAACSSKVAMIHSMVVVVT